MLRMVDASAPDYAARLQALCARSASIPEEIEAAARQIIRAVRARGDAAIRELTERFEGRKLEALELPRATRAEMAARVSAPVRQSLESAAARIRAFHEKERYSSFELVDGGTRVGCRLDPLERAGLYVPGGTARYPSTVLMTAIPARVAGVRDVVMTTPGPSPETLAAAEIAGVDRVFVIGGAQAIAALAYGTESVPRVDKIVGPGNAYVAAAKRLVFGDVGIDSIAGPTELVIAADDSTEARWLAADLLAQAEHDPLAVPILLATDGDVARRVAEEVERQVALLPRREIAEQALRGQGAIFVIPDEDEMVRALNLLAPEHTELALRRAREIAPRITTSGALFLGSYTPESVGDYLAGPSHVLPTGGSARFASPLGVIDFLKRTSIIEYDEPALRRQADDIERIAIVEGLDAHARAVTIRTRG
jgi:histidinol dehydrogenase